jgi:ABC-type uncharacterized transport system involved in gliding motility auxiliary subunit
MKTKLNTRLTFRIQQIIFYILLLIVVTLLAQFTLKYNKSFDWTQNSRHTLSLTTQSFLTSLDKPITIKAFVSPNSDYKTAIEQLAERYQEQSNLISIEYIDPNFSPDQVRQFNIQQQGEMIVLSDSQQQIVYDLSEQSLTNAMMAVSRTQHKWLLFIEGHGERTPFNDANFNLSTWGKQLEAKGFKFRGFNLAENRQIPENTAAIIIASPERAWLPGEVSILANYIENGGNLLWLSEPNTNTDLLAISERLNIEFLPGTIIDANAELLGIDDPQFVLITDYANHPVSQATTSVTLLPTAVAIEQNQVESKWDFTALFNTQHNTWADIETDATGSYSFDEGIDTLGPLTAGVLLTRLIPSDSDRQQRIAVIGDGDFISNTYLGNGGNLDVSLALINWLTHDDQLVPIPVKTTIDSQLDLSKTQAAVIGLGFLFILPILLLSIGAWIWWSRRRR